MLNAISRSVSLPIGDAETISPSPNALCSTRWPTEYCAFCAGVGFLNAEDALNEILVFVFFVTEERIFLNLVGLRIAGEIALSTRAEITNC